MSSLRSLFLWLIEGISNKLRRFLNIVFVGVWIEPIWPLASLLGEMFLEDKLEDKLCKDVLCI